MNEALRRNHQNIIELLLKKKVNLTLFEVNSEGQKCYPMDLANEAQKSIITRYTQNQRSL